MMCGGNIMELEEIVGVGAVVFYNRETDILIAWNGEIEFPVYAGKFNGDYDQIDSFYRDVQSVAAAGKAAEMWFQEHATFNPGP